jgi:hypothetical protein
MNGYKSSYLEHGGLQGQAAERAVKQGRLGTWRKKKLHLALPLWMRGLGDEGGVRFFS